MKKSKVLFILHLPNPIHGAAVVGQLIRDSTIINNAFDADYINLSTSEQLNEIGKGGTGKLINLLKIQLKVLKALISKKYDLCYMTLTAKGPGFYKDLFIVIILKLFGKRIIYHFHNKGISARQNNKFDNLLYTFTFNNTQAILLSSFLYNDIEKYIKRENVFFCSNGIPENKELTLKRKVIDENCPCYILFLSNMMVQKGVFVLLKACKLLKEKNLIFECHFVGAWFDISEEEFNDHVIAYDLTKHVFSHGKKYGEEKLDFLNRSDIFSFPTYNETFGLVLLEAMEFALPIVSTPEGGIPDIVIDKETGFLVPQQDAAALAEKIELLIKQPELRFRMGMAGKNRFNNLFTIEKFENRFSDILKQAIKN